MTPIPADADQMPDSFSYDPSANTLLVGSGSVSSVLPAVWNYRVSGRPLLASWLAYRMRNPKGRTSRGLNSTNATMWPADWTTELLELLHVLGRLVELEPEQAQLLDAIMTGPLVDCQELTVVSVLPVKNSARKPAGEAAVDPSITEPTLFG